MGPTNGTDWLVSCICLFYYQSGLAKSKFFSFSPTTVGLNKRLLENVMIQFTMVCFFITFEQLYSMASGSNSSRFWQHKTQPLPLRSWTICVMPDAWMSFWESWTLSTQKFVLLFQRVWKSSHWQLTSFTNGITEAWPRSFTWCGNASSGSIFEWTVL